MKYWPIIGILLLTACEKKTQVMPATSTEGVTRPLLFIMAGQSNMAGDFISSPIPQNTAQITYVNTPGVGPIIPFSHDVVAKKPGMQAVVVNCAQGGTLISQWSPDLGLYKSCMAYVLQAQKTYNAVISGFFFLQGEADASGPNAANGYPATYDWAQAFTALIRRVRYDLNLPNLPVVFGQINHTTQDPALFPWWSHIQEEQASVSMTNCTMVFTSDLALDGTIHYTQESYAILGQRFANSWYAEIH